ncbi:hypothetical protein DPMN_004350 [Dreissena polymorpha]|uniref:Uncharacterized protein n=1 Tax=Dreissena polymorpha TaxID=45954 RepID=A0A9D4MRL2_DREPO|nr:hypothetical protein DPMN_004350 [Dreissena polymorpha]
MAVMVRTNSLVYVENAKQFSENPLFKALYFALCDFEGLEAPYLVGKLMELLVNNLISPAITAVPTAIMLPFVDWVAPKHLKKVTSSSF